MMAIYGPLRLILDVAFFIMIVHIIMSWLINFQVLNLHQPMVAQIWQGINRLLEPIYQPLRRVLPNINPLDLAPLVAFVIIISLRDYILPELLLRLEFFLPPNAGVGCPKWVLWPRAVWGAAKLAAAKSPTGCAQFLYSGPDSVFHHIAR